MNHPQLNETVIQLLLCVPSVATDSGVVIIATVVVLKMMVDSIIGISLFDTLHESHCSCYCC